MSNREQMANANPEQMKASMASWEAWSKKAGAALLDVGAPLGGSTLINGTAGTGHIGGYSFVQADSLDAAKQLFDAHPALEMPGASIEILEQMSMGGK
jgi:hypothetical protein